MSIRLIKISKDELPEVVFISYQGDEDLLDKYHINKCSLEEAVKKEVGLIEKMSTQLEFTYLKVMINETVIGYIVKSGNFLYSFAVSIYYRTSKILKEWWSFILQEMGQNFKVALMNNNTRAIEYFQKRGLKIVMELDGEVLLTN